ncbi:[acyl-carrier-protein] S-malonyltransferase [Georgenia soli]|uniref:[acyl-carrier-protein] S-malonyltransferase n=1 Tax=Georgenia soli TaxID=638953 RepID=A0A2A9EQS3_9MICO|nr:ACP S-malonyltransferase [Georgenia soli]PFG41324.1 [acyl-carrier-protein] S-malonyltransferase [Georgenia soli]
MLALLCPGQGAQTPGMLAPWLEEPELRERLGRYAEVTELDLVSLGTTADADTIRDTRVAQPLIVAASLLSRHALGLEDVPEPDATAGHSVGELAAAAVAGVLTDEQALMLVRERGRAMADAAGARPTGMTAVVGGKPDEVAEVLARHGLTAANVNGGGQVVAAGTAEQLQALAADPPARARVIPLQVAGAFHTEHMAPAVERVRTAASSLAPADPHLTLLSNADGAVVTTGAETLERLVTQVANPVRWDLCCEQLLALGVTGVVELCPGGVLTGLARRTLPGVETVAVKSPEDLPAARDLMTRHGGTR